MKTSDEAAGFVCRPPMTGSPSSAIDLLAIEHISRDPARSVLAPSCEVYGYRLAPSVGFWTKRLVVFHNKRRSSIIPSSFCPDIDVRLRGARNVGIRDGYERRPKGKNLARIRGRTPITTVSASVGNNSERTGLGIDNRAAWTSLFVAAGIRNYGPNDTLDTSGIRTDTWSMYFHG